MHVYICTARSRSVLPWTLPCSPLFFPGDNQESLPDLVPEQGLHNRYSTCWTLRHRSDGRFSNRCSREAPTCGKRRQLQRVICIAGFGELYISQAKLCQVPKEKCLLHRFPTRPAAASVDNGALLNSTFSRQRSLADGMQRGSWLHQMLGTLAGSTSVSR